MADDGFSEWPTLPSYGGISNEDELDNDTPPSRDPFTPSPSSDLPAENSPTSADTSEVKMTIRRGVMQEHHLPPQSPAQEPDDTNYPLPDNIPPLPASLSSLSRPAVDPDAMDIDPPTSEQPLSPPAYIFHRMLQHTWLVHHFAAQLDIDCLINLYSISAAFRAHAQARWTHMMKSWALQHAPINWAVARFRFYSDLCRPDPSGAKRTDNPDKVREVPRLRYLRMIEFREKTVCSIVRELAKAGHRLPSHAKVVLAKLWFAMDFPENKRRIALFRDLRMWSSVDLIVATLVFMKFEMWLTHPEHGGRAYVIRHLMLAQRGLAPLEKVLRRELLVTEAEFVVMMAEWKRVVPAGMHDKNFLGVPAARLGALDREHWLPGRDKLIPVDALVARECVRRDLPMKGLFLSMMTWGYRDRNGNEMNVYLKDDEDEDAIDDVMKEIRAPRPTE